MAHSRIEFRNNLLLQALFGWYALFWVGMAISPADRHDWLIANILPFLFAGALLTTYRLVPLSNLSYLLITTFMTLHAIGSHYTYAQVPFGYWLQQVFELHRNHFDRLAHFAFGLLMSYPVGELFGRLLSIRGFWTYYLQLTTILALSGVWEILESWMARIDRPDLGPAYLGSQGDVWDAQKDLAAAFYGALLCIILMVLIRALHRISYTRPPQARRDAPLPRSPDPSEAATAPLSVELCKDQAYSTDERAC